LLLEVMSAGSGRRLAPSCTKKRGLLGRTERSTGDTAWRIALAGHRRARRVLVEAAGAIVTRCGSVKPCRTGSTACRRQFARLPGRRRSDCAAAIVGSARPAKSCHGDRRRCARDGRLPVGDRPPGPAGLTAIAILRCSSRCTAPGMEPRRGIPIASHVAG